MNKQTFMVSGLIEKYLLGLTSEKEDRIVEKFMESDSDIKAKIFDGQNCLSNNSKTHVQPSFGSVHGSVNSSSIFGKLAKYAVIGLLAVSTIYYCYDNQTLNQSNKKLSAQLGECNKSFASIDQEKATLTSNEYILTHSATKHIQLRGTNLSPEASMQAFYNPMAEVLMIKIDKLVPPPKGKHYHMWADVNGEMIHVGSLSNDAVHLTSLSFVSEAESLNVTIEELSKVDHPDVTQLAMSGKL